MKGAIILCSGGIDSVTTAYYVKKKLNYGDIVILFFNYGQRSLNAERFFSKRCAKEIKAKFIELNLSPSIVSYSSLTRKGKIPNKEVENLRDTKKESKKWYVPARNTIFISYSLGLAESLLINEKIKYDIFLGFKNEGKESYPDTTKSFVKSFNYLSEISTEGKFKIYAPLIEKDKEDIVLLANKLGINLKNTFSCYVNNKTHCGKCLACKLRKAGFYWTGLIDPTPYD